MAATSTCSTCCYGRGEAETAALGCGRGRDITCCTGGCPITPIGRCRVSGSRSSSSSRNWSSGRRRRVSLPGDGAALSIVPVIVQRVARGRIELPTRGFSVRFFARAPRVHRTVSDTKDYTLSISAGRSGGRGVGACSCWLVLRGTVGGQRRPHV